MTCSQSPKRSGPSNPIRVPEYHLERELVLSCASITSTTINTTDTMSHPHSNLTDTSDTNDTCDSSDSSDLSDPLDSSDSNLASVRTSNHPCLPARRFTGDSLFLSLPTTFSYTLIPIPIQLWTAAYIIMNGKQFIPYRKKCTLNS